MYLKGKLSLRSMFSAACSSREADDLTVRSRRSSRLFGRASRMRAKDFLSAGPAAMTGSQPSDMVVPLLQKTCTPTTTTTNTLTRSVCPCREHWKTTVMIYVASLSSPQAEQQSAVFRRVSPLSGNWTGIRPLRTWWVLSRSHLHQDNSVQMCRGLRFTAQQSSRFRAAFFTTLLGFINFSHSK